MEALLECTNGHQEGRGIWDRIGVPARGEPLLEAIGEGFDYKVFRELADISGLKKEEFTSVIHLAPATLRRRSRTGKFTSEESDRLFRFAQVFAAAEDLFEGDRAEAQHWLSHPVRGLGNRRPIDMLGTSAQTQAVLDLIGRLEHGVFS